jgi:RimJ/RimL family protein N-acetyltransferase
LNPPFTNLSTPRLRLRRLGPDDAEALCRYRSRPEVARYQSWETFTRDDAAHLIEDQQGREPAVPGTWFQVVIVEQTTGNVIGDCGLHCSEDDPRQMEIGITLDPAYQRLGYATEALERLLAYVFAALGKHRVSATTDAENHAAAALFRRLGFRQEAHHVEHLWFKGHWGSEFVFALLKREWEARATPYPSSRAGGPSSDS